MIVLSTNNPILSSKLNILFCKSIPSCQISKIPSQIGVVFSRWLLWVPPTLCYLQYWTFCPITSFQIVRFEKFLQKIADIFSRLSFWLLSTLCYLQNWMFCPITLFQMVRIEKLIHKQGAFFPDSCFECNNPMLSSKLNVLSHNSVPSGQIWKIPSCKQKLFSWDDHFEYQQVIYYLQNWSFHPIFLFILMLFALCLGKPYFFTFQVQFW